ncbi:MAG: Gfo/Idh/MocA family oxidoreductase [Clostridia bacterium]|nr:Gfo/Idh/MocA family oxidoreductase [Clostridia bacterium]
MGKLRIGIIGTGNISNTHMASYKKLGNAEIAAVCDLNGERVAAYCEKYGVPVHYTDHRKLLADKSIDAVSICTWNNSHSMIAVDALESGKHVLCEKPLAMNTSEAMAMQRAAERSGRLLMVGFVRRFGKNTKIVKDLIENGRFGDIYYARAGVIRRCGNPTGWFADKSLSGGGPLIDLGVHMIDLCRFVMGNPRAVSVYGAAFDRLGARNDVKMVERYRPMDSSDTCNVEDFASAMIRFDNGSVLAVEVSFTLHTANERLYCEVFGTEAGAEIEPGFKMAGVMDGYNVDITPVYSEDHNRFQAMFDREIAHFADCIAYGTKCISPVEDGVEMMRILDAIYKSAESGVEVRIDRP